MINDDFDDGWHGTGPAAGPVDMTGLDDDGYDEGPIPDPSDQPPGAGLDGASDTPPGEEWDGFGRAPWWHPAADFGF